MSEWRHEGVDASVTGLSTPAWPHGMLAATDCLGHVTSVTYDSMGRVLSHTASPGGGTTTSTYAER